jgi:hypothetical protein
MQPGDFADISVGKILQFVQGARLLNERHEGLHKDRSQSMPTLLYSILFYTKTNIPVPDMQTEVRVLNC